MRIVLAFLLGCTFARADSLSDLKATLATATRGESLTASVTFETSQRDGDDAAASPGKVTARVQDSPAGLQINWERAIMDRAIAEDEARNKNRNLKAPTRSAMDALNATALNNYLNAAPQMLQQLEFAELIEEKVITWHDQPARLLSLRITPQLSEKDKKYIKEVNVTAKVWVGADGWPLAAEQTSDVKGRALLVISFEQHEHQEVRYARAAGRVVMTYHLKESHSAGAGEKGHVRNVATLEVIHL